MSTTPPAPTTALVLAGGKGERLRPLTDDRPKPMVEANGVPILDHHLRWLHHHGIQRAILLTGHLHEVIHDYFGVPRIDGLRVECIAEEHPLGRGGAFRNGFEQVALTDEVVIATNGDVITDQPIAPLVAQHRRSGALATLLLTPMVSPYGIVDVDGQRLVRRFEEKPKLPYWINGGVYVLSAEIFNEFPTEGDHETSTFPRLAAAGRIAALQSDAYWISVESPKDLREAAEWLATR